MMHSGRRSQAPRCASRAAATAPWCSTSARCGGCTRPDLLGELERISSVSGGSITAGVLALKWPQAQLRRRRLSGRLRARGGDAAPPLAGETIDADAVVVGGLLLPGSIGDRVAAAYDEHLFERRTLQDLPDAPRFVINATNVQSGALWRFSKPYMRDYRVGEVEAPTCPLARGGRRLVGVSAGAVAGSSFGSTHGRFTPGSGADLQRAPFTTERAPDRRRRLRQSRPRDRLEALPDDPGQRRRRQARAERSRKPTGRATPIACSTSSTTRCARCASGR